MLIQLVSHEDIAVSNHEAQPIFIRSGERFQVRPVIVDGKLTVGITTETDNDGVVRLDYFFQALRDGWFEVDTLSDEGPKLTATVGTDFSLGHHEILAGDLVGVEFAILEYPLWNVRLNFAEAVLVATPDTYDAFLIENRIKLLYEEEITLTA